MEEVIKLNSVDQYNKMYGLETLHPFGNGSRLVESHSVSHISLSIMDYTLCS